jgi:peptidylprolyl isomerase
MTQAKKGDKVKVQYTGKLEDGTVFSSSPHEEPLQFTIGEGQILPGFEQAVIGMNPGESKIVQIAPENAYGPRLEELVVVIAREQLPNEMNPALGERLQIRQTDGQTIAVTVADVSPSTVTLDANHPLAGKDLTFDIRLLEFA